MALTTGGWSMERTEALLAQLRRTEMDAVLLRVAEADYGCEERAEDAPERVWVLLLTRDGQERSLELDAAILDAHRLSEGSCFHLRELLPEQV